jgi:hypothetical protein
MHRFSRWLRILARSSLFNNGPATELGPAWAGNSVNCVPFRSDAVTTHGHARYVTYYDDAGDIAVVRADLRDNHTVRVTIPNERKPYDAHQSISLGIDPTGYVHLVLGAHNSTVLATRSTAKSIEDGFEDLTEQLEGATYPMFLTLGDGSLVRLFRRGRHQEGAIFVDRWLPDRAFWSTDPEPIISGFGEPWSSGPYLNTPVVGNDGTVYLSIVWRINTAATSAGAVVNVGIDSLISNDGLRSLHTHRGVQLTKPVTPLNSERVIPVPLGSSLINQAAAGLLPNGQPAVLSYWDDGDGIPQYRLGWRDGRQWRVATVSAFATAFRLDGHGTIPVPHSRPEMLVHDDGRIILLHRSVEDGNALVATELYPPDYKLSNARQQVLIAEDLGFYEPIVDRTAWRTRRELVLYVQRCSQGLGRDGKVDRETAPARLMSWVPV